VFVKQGHSSKDLRNKNIRNEAKILAKETLTPEQIAEYEDMASGKKRAPKAKQEVDEQTESSEEFEEEDDEESDKESEHSEEHIAKESVAKESVAKEPVAKEPVAKEPVAKEPVAKEPVVKPVAKMTPPSSPVKTIQPSMVKYVAPMAGPGAKLVTPKSGSQVTLQTLLPQVTPKTTIVFQNNKLETCNEELIASIQKHSRLEGISSSMKDQGLDVPANLEARLAESFKMIHALIEKERAYQL
jgi:hypothetical protein